MKRYLLFGSLEDYDAVAGWGCFVGDYDLPDEALVDVPLRIVHVAPTPAIWAPRGITTSEFRSSVTSEIPIHEQMGVERPQDIPEHYVYHRARPGYSSMEGWAELVDTTIMDVVAVVAFVDGRMVWVDPESRSGPVTFSAGDDGSDDGDDDREPGPDPA